MKYLIIVVFALALFQTSDLLAQEKSPLQQLDYYKTRALIDGGINGGFYLLTGIASMTIDRHPAGHALALLPVFGAFIHGVTAPTYRENSTHNSIYAVTPTNRYLLIISGVIQMASAGDLIYSLVQHHSYYKKIKGTNISYMITPSGIEGTF